MTDAHTTAACRCGKVAFRLAGAPIFRAVCYCASCREAGRRHQATPGADPVVTADGGTDYVLYRKDRVRCVAGGDLIEARRLQPDSPTRRLFARCCNTALAADFTKGHWLSLYSGRVVGELEPPALRMMTADRPAGVTLPDDVPNYPGFSAKFMGKLVLAWVAMGFRRPGVEGVAGPNG